MVIAIHGKVRTLCSPGQGKPEYYPAILRPFCWKSVSLLPSLRGREFARG